MYIDFKTQEELAEEDFFKGVLKMFPVLYLDLIQ